MSFKAQLRAISRYVWHSLVFPDAQMLHAQASWVLRKTSLAVIFCCLGCWGAGLATVPFSERFLIVWNGCLTFLCMAIAWRARYLQKWRDEVKFAKQLAIEQVLMMAALGLACAIYVNWFFSYADEVALMANLLVLGSIVSGCLAFSATYLPIFLAFSLPITLTVWCNALDQFGKSELIDSVAFTLPIYLTALVYFGLQYQRSGVELIQTRFERERLNSDLQKQMAQTDAARLRAEAAEQAQTRFLAATSHDLRQPLQALVLFLQALDRQGLCESQSDVLAKVDLSVRSLSTMLNGLLDYSRIHAGGTHDPRPMALQPLLFDLSVEFGAAADEKKIALRLRDTTAWVQMDALALQLILRNLLANAIRYTHQGGVLLGVRLRRDNVVVEVWDTGEGIATSHLPHIFETYYQVNNPERNVNKGLGLGLSIVHDLAAQTGVKLEVQSRLGRGSVFRCVLPRAQAHHNSAEPQAHLQVVPPDRNLQGLHVLVVDDHADVLDAMGHMLTSMGCVVECATDLAQAKAFVRERPIQVVLTDYRLAHDETGVDVIDALRVLKPMLPAVLYTGDIGLRDRLQAQLVGVPVLIKPVPQAALLLAFAEVLPCEASRLGCAGV